MKERLDVSLVKRGLFSSREKARIAVMEGRVFVAGQREDKPGTMIAGDAEVEVHKGDCPFVSRGGKKLARALEVFDLNLTGLVCADLGASTGGFTDCMLQAGACRVYAVDVGYGQLAWQLRTDERVVCMERTNVRYLTPEDLGEPVDFLSIDVSFISLSKVLPAAFSLLKPSGRMVCLIKPQFEAGRDRVGKKGVVRDPIVHEEVIEAVFGYAAANGLYVCGLTYSPIKGPEGNIEYLLLLKKGESTGGTLPDAAAVVREAHQVL